MSGLGSLTSLLAVGFDSPWLLTGLAGAAIPVIIHLLNKRKYRESPWAAMRFLAEAARKHSRRLRWEQLLLLLVRCLAVACLALAFSRPFFTGGFSVGSDRQPRHLIVVLDDSFSMGTESAGTTRFERARELAKQAVDASSAGDAFSLIGMTSTPEVSLSVPTFRKESMLSELAEFSLTEEPANLSALFDRLDATLREATQLPRKEILLISDFQKRDWLPDNSAEQATIKSRLATLSKTQHHFTLINPGRERIDNLAIGSISITPQPVILGQTSTVSVTLRKFASELPENLSIELIVNERPIASQPLPENVSDGATFSFEQTWSELGDNRLVCQLRSDSLPLDNTWYRTVNVREQIRVLLVEGRPGSSTREQSSFYLQAALETLRNRGSSNSLVATSLTDEIGFRDLPLRQFDILCLCNLPGLREADLVRVQEHLARGGGLLILLGDRSRSDLWNPALQTLFPEASVRLRESAGNTAEAEAVGFLTNDFSHPIVQMFEGNPGTGLETAVIWKRTPLELSGLEKTRPVLQFDDGSPAIFEVEAQRGRTLIATMSFDALAGSWAPLSGSFLPVAAESMRYLAAEQSSGESILVGAPLAGSLPQGTWVTQGKVRLPSGETVELVGTEVAGNEWSFAETDTAGFYLVDFGIAGVSPELFAVNTDRRESDLELVDSNSLERELFPSERSQVRASWSGTDDSLLTDSRNGSSIVTALLWLGLSLLLCEVALAWRFPLGLVCLALVGLIAGVVWTAEWTRPAAAISSGLLVAALLTMVILQRRLRKTKPAVRRRGAL